MSKEKLEPKEVLRNEEIALTKKIFEPLEISVRREVFEEHRVMNEAMEAWKEGIVNTGVLIDRLEVMLGKAETHSRLKAILFDTLLGLTERTQAENKFIAERSLARVLSESNPQLRYVFTALLGARLNPNLLSKEIAEGKIDSLNLQSANLIDAFINDLYYDQDAPEDIRRFAEVLRTLPRSKENLLYQELTYFGALYRGDPNRLLLDIEKLDIPLGGETMVRVREVVLIGEINQRKLLPEFSAPSFQKEREALENPRKRPPEEKGRVISLRTFLTSTHNQEAGKKALVTIERNPELLILAGVFKSRLREITLMRIPLDQKIKLRERAKQELLDALWPRLAEEDTVFLGERKYVSLQCETLVDEDVVKRMLKDRFRESNPDIVDPTGGLRKEIERIIMQEKTGGEIINDLGLFLDSMIKKSGG